MIDYVSWICVKDSPKAEIIDEMIGHYYHFKDTKNDTKQSIRISKAQPFKISTL